MAKKREFIMKQPELGRKILELRKGLRRKSWSSNATSMYALFSGLKLAK
jgi:hypothetical protein